MNATIFSRAPRRAFTLVELLVVIIIIGMLAALATRAAMQAVTQAKNTAITLEIQTIGNAIEANLDKFGGAYPTNFGQTAPLKNNRIISQMRRMFPRVSFSDVPTLQTYIKQQYLTHYSIPLATNMYRVQDLDQSEALVFWLGGMPLPDGFGSTKLYGFSANIQAPFDVSPDTSRRPKLFEFDESRLVDNDGDGWLEYIPNASVDTSPAPPFIYFDGQTLSASPVSYLPYNAGLATWGSATGYFQSAGVPVAPKKFQIIAAGLDGVYGSAGTARPASPPLFPSGDNYQEGDLDNLTSFSDGTLQTAQEAE